MKKKLARSLSRKKFKQKDFPQYVFVNRQQTQFDVNGPIELQG